MRSDRQISFVDHFTESNELLTLYQVAIKDNFGLFKGSTSQLMDSGHRIVPAERPKTLRKLQNVYENVNKEGSNNGTSGLDSAVSSTDKSLSILSPFDEQEEWAKISEIMASFSSGLVRDSVFVAEMEKEIQSRLGFGTLKKTDDSSKTLSKVGQWLAEMNLNRHERSFLDHGYDDLDFLNGLLDEDELKLLGLSDEEVTTFLRKLEDLPNTISEVQKRCPMNGLNNNNNVNNINNKNDNNNECGDGGDGEESRENCEDTVEKTSEVVDKWLETIHLGVYKDTFKRHSYLDMERIRRIWEIELSSVLDITRRGHRRRILASVNAPFRGDAAFGPNLDEITADLSQLAEIDVACFEHSFDYSIDYGAKKLSPHGCQTKFET
ncbi:hypothetical protein RUM43_006208 [Polyplax serrata]|uniref:SAM domain-containing protein n=1 Tax=Polyplax serrata TaxID=468196 RepID=A0AAN8NXX5_POLSC